MGKNASEKSLFYLPSYQLLTSPLASLAETSGTLNGNEGPFLAPISAILAYCHLLSLPSETARSQPRSKVFYAMNYDQCFDTFYFKGRCPFGELVQPVPKFKIFSPP